MRSYLLTHSAMLAPESVHQILNQTQSIETWLSPFPYAAVLISRLTISELSAVMHSHFGDTWFILVETSKDNVNGWLPQQFWDYLIDPQTAWSQQLFAKLHKNLPPPPQGLLGK